jgi:adenylate cyclase
MKSFGKNFMVGPALSVLFIAVAYWDPSPLETLRFKTFDLYQQIKPREQTKLPVVIVEIDEPSLAELGQWPWPRTLLADLTDKIRSAGALVVGFDIVFAEPDRLSPKAVSKALRGVDEGLRGRIEALPGNDEVFAATIARGRVVLGQAATNQDASQSDLAAARKTGVGQRGPDPRRFLDNYPSLVRNIPELEKAAAGLGVSTVLPDADGVVRRVATVYNVRGELFPAFGPEMLRVATGGRQFVIRSDEAGITGAVLTGVAIPTEHNGLSWIRFNAHDPGRFVSAKDVLSGAVPPERLRGHLVLVGASAAGLLDIRATPLGTSMPGVEIIAQWLETVLTGAHLTRPNFMVVVEYGFLLALCLFLAVTVPKVGALISFVIGGGSVLVLIGTSWYFFSAKGVMLGVAYPAIAGFLLYSILIFIKYMREEKQRRQLRHAFNHYVSPDLVSEISADPGRLELGGESRELTFLFTDIAGFTSLTERTEPAMLVKLLNDYLDPMCRIVMTHGGTIDKIVGDAIHAIFGAPSTMPDHAARAVACALEMDAFARAFEKRKAEEGIKFGITRIGVNTGRAVVGNFGGEARFDYTAHGDAINMAARMESVNKYLGTRVCVSGATAEGAPGVKFRPVGSLVLKGATFGIPAFEPLSEEEFASPRVAAYNAAFAVLDNGADQAKSAFANVEQEFPGDPLVAFHLARLQSGESGSVVVMAEK